MDYGERMGLLLQNIEKLTQLSDIIDTDFIEKLDKINTEFSSVDWDEVGKTIVAAEKIEDTKRDIRLVENGLHDIKHVVEMQNQVANVSDIRDQIGLVAGNTEAIREVAEYKDRFSALVAMKPMIDDVLSLSVKMDTVIDMESDIKEAIKSVNYIEEIFTKMVDVSNEIKSSEAKNNATLVRILNVEKRVEKKLAQIEEANRIASSLTVVSKQLGEDETAYAIYDEDINEITIGIPQGKTGPRGNYKGDKGEPGRDGKDFSPTFMGSLNDRNRYSSFPVGTSFLSLDEIPTMIYFRKSNANDDWTEGQPFGVSNGGYSDEDKGIDIVDGLNIDELTTHVIRNMQRRKDG